MIQLHCGNASVIVLEPANIVRMKRGKEIEFMIGDQLIVIAFTPDAQALKNILMAGSEPLGVPGEMQAGFVHLEPSTIKEALDLCQRMPEVLRD